MKQEQARLVADAVSKVGASGRFNGRPEADLNMYKISYSKYETVRDVLAQGRTLKEAARIAGVSEPTAARIRDGYVPPKPEQVMTIKTVKQYRCKGCGGLVKTEPCLTCVCKKL